MRRNIAGKCLLYAAGVGIVIGLRGVFIASLVGGRYLPGSFVEDLCGLLIVLAVCRLFYYGFIVILNKLLRGEKRLMRAGRSLLQVAFVFLVIFPFLFVVVQMFPQKISTTKTPGDFGLQYREITMLSSGVELKGWYLPSANSDKPGLVFAHGLSANRQNFLPLARELSTMGYPLLIFDFRAHGDSLGRLFTAGVDEASDVKAAHDFLAKELPGRRIAAIGYSAGAAAIFKAMADYGIFEAGAVLDSGYYRLEGVVKDSLLKYAGPLRSAIWRIGCWYALLLSGKDFSSYDLLKRAAAMPARKLLLIHGEKDSVTPPDQTVALSRALPAEAKLWIVNGAGHLQAFTAPGYWARLEKFLDAAGS